MPEGNIWGGADDALDRAAEAQAREAAQQYELQARQLSLQGKVAEANIANQKAQIALRKAELAQQRYLTERSQQMQASGMLAQLRGPGNWFQFLDLGRRLSSFGTQSPALAQIAAGGMPQGAFVPGGSGKPTSLQERMSGMIGAGESAGNEQLQSERERNDKNLALQIASNSGKIARGSIQSLAPAEQQYLQSAMESGDVGHDWDSFIDAYKRAGIMQGGGRG
jgi:hypothetical protein